MENLDANNPMNSIIKIAPILKELLGEEYAISISDTEKFLLYIPGANIDHKVTPGFPIERTVSHRCVKEGRRLTAMAGSETFGFPYMGKVVCVRDEQHNIVGTLGISLPITLVEKIKDLSVNLVSAVNEISAYTTNLSAASAQELSSTVPKEVSSLITAVPVHSAIPLALAETGFNRH